MAGAGQCREAREELSVFRDDSALRGLRGDAESFRNVWLYPSAPSTRVEIDYDVRTFEILSTSEGVSTSAAGSINAVLKTAEREDQGGSTKHGRGNGVRLPAASSSSSSSRTREDTDRWLHDLHLALESDRGSAPLFAQAPSLRRSVWCNDAVESDGSGEEADEGDIAAADDTSAAVDAEDNPRSGVVSFSDMFSNKTFSSALEDFIGGARPDEDTLADDGDESGDQNRGPSPLAPIAQRSPYKATSGAEVFGDDSELEKLMDHLDKHDDFWHQARQAVKEKKDKKRWAVSERIEDLDRAFAEEVKEPAIQYPFELDAFQKEAIIHLERNESVFVAAHTSAGKTVVAEYAFALSTKHCSRAVYTSPIKTISNQKFRDFTDDGFDVGLLTGDVSIKPEASSLIMTTEILRSMLYRGANIIRDIEWVIFDEVHYVNDLERGVVWEEVIIMLPETVNIVCLSATVPNVIEFADWIGRTKRQNIYITGTLKRPVPLEHNLYYQGEMYKVCEANAFSTSGYKKAFLAHKKANAPKPLPSATKSNNRNKLGPNSQHRPQQQRQQQRYSKGHSLNNERTQLSKLLGYLKKEELLPTIVFAFSKKRCDLLADYVRSRDLTTSEEKHEIHVFCNKSFSRLTGTDRNLPQILRVQDLLKKGIGVHHSGLLPIVREVVEMLFCKGLVKILFSTETFAMGVNAPARSVVFHSLRKHDGQSFRTLLSGEYTQMAGRAGRRGLDKFGIVIIACVDAIPGELELKKLLTGSATRLQSQFRLTYNMILQLLRVDEMKIEDMIRRSFAEFHAQAALPSTKALLKKANKACTSLDMVEWPIDKDGCAENRVRDYAECVNGASEIAKRLMAKVRDGHAMTSIFAVGRPLLYYQDSAGDVPQIAIVCQVKTTQQKVGLLTKNKKKLVLLLLHNTSIPMDEAVARLEETTKKMAEAEARAAGNRIDGGVALISKKGSFAQQTQSFGPQILAQKLLVTMESKGRIWSLIEAEVEDVLCILRGELAIFDAGAVLANDDASIGGAIDYLAKTWENFLGQRDMVVSAKSDLKLQDIDDIQSYLKLTEFVQRMQGFECNTSNRLFEQFRIVQAKMRIGDRISELRHKISDAALQQMPEFHQRIAVLQAYGYLDPMQLVKIKGRVAVEVNSCDELLATEMIFRGLLTSLKAEEAIALMSSLVFQDKAEADLDDAPEALRAKTDDLTDLAIEIGETQEQCKMHLPPEDYVRSCLNFGLVRVVYDWARGLPFSEICDHTDVMEGSIVRTIIRLEETCREFKDAARVMGDPQLLKLMEEASFMIKRDVIFAASLYVQ